MRFCLALILAALPLAAQDPSAEIRPHESANAQANVLGEFPTNVIEVEKAKGTVASVDLAARTVSIRTKKGADDLLLRFSQPSGREQIKTSKKAEKKLGKKRLRLEELNSGQAVQIRYYPALGQIMEMTVDAS